MPRNSISYELLIASPSDVVVERQIIADVVGDWNSAHARTTGIFLQPRRWELDAVPEIGDRPQALINKQLVEEADVLIGVFSSWLGTPTGVAVSGTVEEIERFVELKKPVMLYFSTGPVPHNHDPAQFQLLKDYKRQIGSTGIYFEYDNAEDLRRKVTRYLAQIMESIAGFQTNPAPAPKPELARVYIEKELPGRSGAIRTANIAIIIENISPVKRITEYSCTISVPSACLTFTSTHYMCEIKSNVQGRRSFRRMDSDDGAIRMIPPGDKKRILNLELGIEQLKMKGTRLEGDFEGVLADKVTVDAIVGGEQLHLEKLISEIFEGMI